jgi:hypothetical protein
MTRRTARTADIKHMARVSARLMSASPIVICNGNNAISPRILKITIDTSTELGIAIQEGILDLAA